MKIGFSGSQVGLTEDQYNTVFKSLEFLRPTEAHHGRCLGADTRFHQACLDLKIPVVLHPGCDYNGNSPKSGYCPCPEKILDVKPYLDRNKDIVDSVDLMIACPKGFEEEFRSGTWSTIRYFVKKKKRFYIVFPDGSLKTTAQADLL
jgi:hypothetical protein